MVGEKTPLLLFENVEGVAGGRRMAPQPITRVGEELRSDLSDPWVAPLLHPLRHPVAPQRSLSLNDVPRYSFRHLRLVSDIQQPLASTNLVPSLSDSPATSNQSNNRTVVFSPHPPSSLALTIGTEQPQASHAGMIRTAPAARDWMWLFGASRRSSNPPWNSNGSRISGGDGAGGLGFHGNRNASGGRNRAIHYGSIS